MANNATFTIRLEGGVAPSAGKVTVGIEVRMCVGQNGNRLYLHAPFKNAQIGNNASALAGDDKRIGTCQRKFNNVANFPGFPYMPKTNAIRGIGESKAKERQKILMFYRIGDLLAIDSQKRMGGPASISRIR